MKKPSPATYALLGLLAVQPWTGYELTRQARRSLRFIWPSSEGHLYREQKRLAQLGWATVDREAVGKRHRNRYSITPEGREALAEWLQTDPGEPGFEIEGIIRVFFGDHGTPQDMAAAMRKTSKDAGAMLDDMLDFVDEYLDTGGSFPERLHVIALAVEVITSLLDDIETFFSEAADEVEQWPTASGLGMTPATRSRLETIQARYGDRRR